jgi:hypothetical protein
VLGAGLAELAPNCEQAGLATHYPTSISRCVKVYDASATEELWI